MSRPLGNVAVRSTWAAPGSPVTAFFTVLAEGGGHEARHRPESAASSTGSDVTGALPETGRYPTPERAGRCPPMQDALRHYQAEARGLAAGVAGRPI